MTVYTLGPDDMPTCPKHGTRVITDFLVTEEGLTYERGKCQLCNKTYHFWSGEKEPVTDQKLTSR